MRWILRLIEAKVGGNRKARMSWRSSGQFRKQTEPFRRNAVGGISFATPLGVQPLKVQEYAKGEK
jgi:hypothetical protein